MGPLEALASDVPQNAHPRIPRPAVTERRFSGTHFARPSTVATRSRTGDMEVAWSL